MRLAVAGNVLAMSEPRTAWAKNFLQMPVSDDDDMQAIIRIPDSEN
jgi:hypothetical protein